MHQQRAETMNVQLAVGAYFEMLAIPDSPAGGTRSPLDKHAQICYSVIVPDNDNRKPSKGFSL